jgi:type IV pilus assembly protein PilB
MPEDHRGDIKDRLLREGIVALDVLNDVLKEQEKNRMTLLDAVIQFGKFDEKKLTQLIIKEYGYASVNPGIFLIERDLLNLVPQKMAEKYLILPISLYEQTLTVAFANPGNVKIIDEIRAITGKRIKAVVAEASVLKRCIQKSYGEAASGGGNGGAGSIPTEEGKQTADLDELVKMVEMDHQAEDPSVTADLMKSANETPVIKLVNMVLLEGIRRKASDIFIEPWENHVRVRVRVDGLLEEVIRPPKSLGTSIVSRIKVMSELNIAERRVPQDGRFKIKVNQKEIDMRVSILPSSFGEKVCLRILDTTNQGHDIAKLGFTDKEQQTIKDSAKKPHGMILVTGPTGSGKTTTLYSVLKYLDNPEVNITTVEDPVEYQLVGVNQVNVREQIGLTFPASLRSILRQDPDIILIGEIRDNETLDIAVKAALTGHLVLSTLHTNDAASSVTRMMNMGLEPFLIASTVLMISAQRLVRRICQRCKAPAEVDKMLFGMLGIDDAKKGSFFKGKGCGQCRQSGYKGRTVITEILEMKPEIRDIIMAGGTSETIKREAHKIGLSTLRESALRKAMIGETTLEEVIRVTGEDQGLKKKESEKAA